MARRSNGLLDLLVMVPWWVSVLVSTGAYVFVAYVAPAILGQQHRLLGPLARELPSLAPAVALVFLLPAPLSVFRQWRARRLLDSQTGPESIRAMSWQRFETLVGEAYRRQGYSVEEIGGGGPDGSVDLVVRKDDTCLVQCKHWRAYRVGVKEVRELFGVVVAEQAGRGALITSGYFTPEARAFAAGKPLELIDGRGIVALVKAVQKVGRTDPVSCRMPPDDSLSTRNTLTAPPCPACNRSMVLRTARHGANAGTRFWGCPAYPTCRATVPLQG